MIAARDAVYLSRECAKLDIKVAFQVVEGDTKINIMRGQFSDFESALRYVQGYQAEQGARWAAYKPPVKDEFRSVIDQARVRS